MNTVDNDRELEFLEQSIAGATERVREREAKLQKAKTSKLSES